MKRSLKTAVLAFALAAAASGGAMAENGEETFTFRLSPASLENTETLHAAYLRLDEEARKYCRAFNLRSDADLKACNLEVVFHVVSRVNDPRLSALHDARLDAERAATLERRRR